MSVSEVYWLVESFQIGKTFTTVDISAITGDALHRARKGVKAAVESGLAYPSGKLDTGAVVYTRGTTASPLPGKRKRYDVTIREYVFDLPQGESVTVKGIMEEIGCSELTARRGIHSAVDEGRLTVVNPDAVYPHVWRRT